MRLRRKAAVVDVGGVKVGGDHPIVVQSMTNTDTADAPSTGGGYGVQLASSPNEADANAAFAQPERERAARMAASTPQKQQAVMAWPLGKL